jgi:hypothetical protein
MPSVCVCYGSDEYEGSSAPLKVFEKVDEAKEWWSQQAFIFTCNLKNNQNVTCCGHHDFYCIAEFTDIGVTYYYERKGARNHGPKTWRITETKEFSP